MDFPDRRTFNVLLTTVLLSAVLGTLYVAREIIVTCAFAILLAYLIDPVVRFLQAHSLLFRNLRGPHVLEAYLAFLLCVGLLGHAFAPGAINFNSKLLKAVPTVIQRLSTGEIAESIGHKYHWTDAQQSQLKQLRLVSRIYGLILVLGAGRACDIGLFPWHRRCGIRKIFWSLLEFCC